MLLDRFETVNGGAGLALARVSGHESRVAGLDAAVSSTQQLSMSPHWRGSGRSQLGRWVRRVPPPPPPDRLLTLRVVVASGWV